MADKRSTAKKTVKRAIKKAVKRNPGLLGKAGRAFGGRRRQIEEALGPQTAVKKKRAVKRKKA